jgi:hypothetical protein
MKLADIVSHVVIDPRKLIEYALDPESLWGRLLSRGARELRSGGELSLAPRHPCTGGRQAVVRTGWFVPHGADEARLVTLYARR